MSVDLATLARLLRVLGRPFRPVWAHIKPRLPQIIGGLLCVIFLVNTLTLLGVRHDNSIELGNQKASQKLLSDLKQLLQIHSEVLVQLQGDTAQISAFAHIIETDLDAICYSLPDGHVAKDECIIKGGK